MVKKSRVYQTDDERGVCPTCQQGVFQPVEDVNSKPLP